MAINSFKASRKTRRIKGFGGEQKKRKIENRVVVFAGKVKKVDKETPVEQENEESWTETDQDFGSVDYLPASESHHVGWLNPGKSGKDAREFAKLSVKEKKLRSLIAITYKDKRDSEKAYMVYKWKVEYLSKIDDINGRKFLFLKPDLSKWEGVFQRNTESQTILFNLHFFDVYQFVLDPGLWAGKSLKYTLFLYYLFLTKKYIVYVDSEKLFYQYDGKKWRCKNPQLIIEEVAAWTGNIGISGADKLITSNDKEVLNKFKNNLTIKEWPYVTGQNLGNGFLTLKDGKYTLLPHSPGLWQKDLCDIEISSRLLPVLPEKHLRLLLDLCSEDLVNLNIIKTMLFFTMETGNHNLIFNLNGNPKGAKSLLMEYVSDVYGEQYKVGRFHSLNSFNREDLLLNARVIAFPDANPKALKAEHVDLLKSISGRDPIHVETKFGGNYKIKSDALIILTNNEDFDAVPAFREAAMADRVLNLVIPAIKSEGTVLDLKKKLGNQTPWLFLFSLSLDPELLECSQRSSEFNAVTDSGAEKTHIKFLMDECTFVENEKVSGESLHKHYTNYVQKFDKKAKAEPLKSFYQKILHYTDKVTPRGVEKIKTNKGVTFKNLKIGHPGKEVKTPYQHFKYGGTEKMKKLLNQNGLRIDFFVFRDKQGRYIKGPRLNPELNKKMYDSLQQVKDVNLKLLFNENYPLGKMKHFETSCSRSEKLVHDLELKDFEENEIIQFQPELQYSQVETPRLTDLGKFSSTELTDCLSGERKTMIAKVNLSKRKRVIIKGVSKDYNRIEEFGLQTNYFLDEMENTTNSKLVDSEKEKNTTNLEQIFNKTVQLETYYPKTISKEATKTQTETLQSQDGPTKPTIDTSKRRGRPKKARAAKKHLETKTETTSQLEKLEKILKDD